MILALDTSGSMEGEPIEALKNLAVMIGEKYYSAEHRPFEKLLTILYNHELTEFPEDTKENYTEKIKSLYAEGGTDLMAVMTLIEDLVNTKPGLKELVVVFLTDGEDSQKADHRFEDIAKRIKDKDGLRSQFFAVGFSRFHDANFVSRMINFGSEKGHFFFIDCIVKQGLREKLTKSLIEKLDDLVFKTNSTKVQLRIKNEAEKFDQVEKTEILFAPQQKKKKHRAMVK